MKKLVTGKTIKEFAMGNEKVFPVDDNTLITPAAKDEARSRNIVFVHKDEIKAEEPAKAEVKPEESSTTEATSCKVVDDNVKIDRQKLVEAVMKALDEKGLLDKIID